MISLIRESSRVAFCWISSAKRVSCSGSTIWFSMSSAYPEIAVSGVFSSWETFAVKSCRTFAAIRIFSCCLRIVFTNGTSSLYTGSSMVSSMFSASRSIGCSNCLVKKCARTIQMETISISISITNGDAARNTL